MDKFVVRKRPTDDISAGSETDDPELPCKVKKERIDENTQKTKQSSPKSEVLETDEEQTDDKQYLLKARAAGLSWKQYEAENLDCDYVQLFSKREADDLYKECEEQLVYNTGKLAQVNIFGKWHNIPRKQVAHGDTGLTYTFSNNCIPARPWIPFLTEIRDKITQVTGQKFNFVLINRYNDGNDHMGAHRDDEKDLVPTASIASLSLGQARDFVFQHANSRGNRASRDLPPITIELQHGSLLMMNHPTNVYWYHSLPRRKRASLPRINMTFRQMILKDECKDLKETDEYAVKD
ncbi:DNA oxidative demethylase ALKBH2-like [Glandiceps talaboti]